MPDPTPDPVMKALMMMTVADGRYETEAKASLYVVQDYIASVRALLAELLADHYARAHRTMDAHPEDECRVWAAQGMPGCQAPERTRRLGVEGAG